MHFEVKNIRGIRRADFNAEPKDVTLIAGLNAAGKSSLLGAIAGAILGDPLPEGVPRNRANMLVTHGEREAYCIVENANGRVALTLPDLKVGSTGSPPQSTPIACGSISLADMAPASVAGSLIQALHVRVSPRAIETACATAGLDNRETVALIEQLKVRGWDEYHDVLVKRRAEAKGAWRQITSKNWGSNQGATWRPEGWMLDLETADDDALSEERRDRAQELEESIRRAGAAEATYAEQTQLAANKNILLATLRTAADDRHAAEESHAGAQARKNGLLPIGVNPEHACPHCTKPISILVRQGAVVHIEKAAEAIDAIELKRRRDLHAAADGEIARLAANLPAFRATEATAQANYDSAVQAEIWLKNNPGGSDLDADLAEDSAEIRESVTIAESRLRMFRQHVQAQAKHREIVSLDLLIEALAPDGLRHAALTSALETFNTELTELSASTNAAWPNAQFYPVPEGVVVGADGTPFAFLSSSEQWRVRVILQVAVAIKQQVDLVLIDGGDIVVDPAARKGLYNLTVDQPFVTIVAVAHADRRDVIDLGAAGVGATWWIKDGVLGALEPVEMRA